MLYILRLTNGDCVLALAADEPDARQTAIKLTQDEGSEVRTVRHLEHFAVQFSPTDEGTLEVARWEDATLDGILASDYPLLYEAYCRANAEPLLKASCQEEKTMAHLQDAYDRNAEIIREGLRGERQRFGANAASEPSQKTKAARL